MSLLAAALALSLAASGPVAYEVTPVIGEAGLEALAVTVRFEGDEDGSTDFALPSSWAGSERLHEAVRGLAVEGGTLSETGDPALRRIDHGPGAPLVVRYRLVSEADADPAAGYEKARPVIRPTWFSVHGEGAFAGPAGRNAAPARFRWGPAPQGWRLGSDLEMAGSLTVNQVGGGILVGGADLRIAEAEVGGQRVRVAMRGDWGFGDAAFAEALGRIIAATNAYMEDQAVPYFVSLVPLTGGERGAISIGGTGRTAGFALASTTNVDLDRLLRLLSHEYGHRWFGTALGPMAESEATDYWFSEGFNDFASAQALVRAGLWDSRAFADDLDEVLLRYAASAARGRPNDALASDYWPDPAARQMVYDRGNLFALLLDGRRAGVREALVRVKAGDGFAADETQARRFARAYGIDPAELEAMLAGAPVELPADLFAPCGAVRTADQPVYASGYTVEEQDGLLHFATVDEQSPAWAAGLRPGMRYVRRISFRFGDSSVPIVMRVADEAGERELSWLPQGRETIRLQRLELGPDAESQACRSRLAGIR